MRRAKREGADYALSMSEVRYQMSDITERNTNKQGETLPEGVRDETTPPRQQFKAAGQDLLVQVLASSLDTAYGVTKEARSKGQSQTKRC